MLHIDISEYYKLHRLDNYADELIISAHGGYTSSTEPFFTQPGVEFVFYCEHGHSLNDPHVRSLMVGRGRPSCGTRSGQVPCMNYELSKYQGRHGDDAESYAEIANAITYAREEYPKLIGGGNGQPAMDVLTVRYRLNPMRFLHTGNLKEAVNWALTKHAYRRIHCNFCRTDLNDANAPIDQAQWPQNAH
ncbi:MAG TPA: hypothetical protein VMG30_19530 [Acidobacteriota bacterium]|nr:hypothetical protein [Acidobacteriota bacterium]